MLASELRAGLGSGPSPAAPSPGAFAETVALPKDISTNSDVNAPTVLTLDAIDTAAPMPQAPPTSAPTVVERAKPEPARPSVPDATVAESAAMASSVTSIPPVRPAVPVTAQPASPAAVQVGPAPPKTKKSSVGLVIGAVVLLAVVGVAAIAGFYLWNRSRTKTGATTSASATTGTAPAVLREVTRYWLELAPKKGAQAVLVTNLAPLASGQSFKFHLVFSESGYVYIFGPGAQNQPTAFLTAKPLPDSGVKTNQVTGGKDFSFPSGSGNDITLDKKPGADVFTIIFAKTPLSEPAFLNEPVTLDPLSPAQQAELKSFVAKYTATPPATERDESNSQAPVVRVKALPDQANNPIVFDIRIQHN
jgi:uncharacterized protein DUF4384